MLLSFHKRKKKHCAPARYVHTVEQVRNENCTTLAIFIIGQSIAEHGYVIFYLLQVVSKYL
jgi:hypothetical protein